MKVAIVTPVLSHFEVPWFRMAAGLPGLDVMVMHTDASGDSYFSEDYREVINWGEPLTAGYPNSHFKTMRELRSNLFAARPGVILQYGYSWKGALAILRDARLKRIAIVHRGLFTIHRDPRRNPAIARLWWLARSKILRQFDAHHYGGDYSWQVLDQIGVPVKRRYFVPYSVDTPFFDRLGASEDARQESRELRARLGWAVDAPVILFLANHAWVKGFDIFMAAAAATQRQRPELRVLIVGAGPLSDEMKVQANSTLAAGSYHFAGFVPSKSTVPYYLASDLVLFPSRLDTWGRAVNEAMICRRPCVTSCYVAASGGLVQNGVNGFVVDGLQPEAFAKCIIAFLSLPLHQRRQMGEAARARALEFSYEAHKDDLYRSLTEVAE